MELLITKELFGGALQIDCPLRLEDIGDHRPIPDNQEVLADANKDGSLIVEIVEHQAEAAGLHCPAKFFFEDLAETSEAVDSSLHSCTNLGSDAVPNLEPTISKSLAIGQMAISKGRQPGEAANIIQVVLAVLQLKDHESDILITLNSPLAINQRSASAEHAGAGIKSDSVQQDSIELHQRILRSFKILDYNLFNGQQSDAVME